jgi:membrane protease YdiL (CAAX protease family)
LPVLSNTASFILFGPLFAPGAASIAADFQRASTQLGIAILFIEVLAFLLLAYFLRSENTSFRGIVNFLPSKVRSYLVAGSIALVPTLATGWLYSIGQAQSGVDSRWSQLSQGQIILWYVLTPLVAAVLEEAIWRGYAIPRMRGALRAPLLTSLSFALFHGIFNPIAVVATFLQGLVWGWAFKRTGSTVPGTVLHFLSRYLALLL